MKCLQCSADRAKKSLLGSYPISFQSLPLVFQWDFPVRMRYQILGISPYSQARHQICVAVVVEIWIVLQKGLMLCACQIVCVWGRAEITGDEEHESMFQSRWPILVIYKHWFPFLWELCSIRQHDRVGAIEIYPKIVAILLSRSVNMGCFLYLLEPFSALLWTKPDTHSTNVFCGLNETMWGSTRPIIKTQCLTSPFSVSVLTTG